MRRLEIKRNKAMYDWHLIPSKDEVGWDLPRFCKAESFKDLPLLFQANDVQYDNFQGNRDKVLYNTLIEDLSGIYKKIKLTQIWIPVFWLICGFVAYFKIF